ncbi:MAG: N-acetylglucosamine-6-phosphate deacetylase [Thermomicrobiales bacterium]
MACFSIAGKVLLENEFLPGIVTIDGDRISDCSAQGLREPSPQLESAYIAPGLIDLQANGGFGAEVGADPEAIRHLASRLPETGVTSFLPTVITSPADYYPRVFEAFAAAKNAPGARALGLHLEGPFLSPQRVGAHRAGLIEAADEELFANLLSSAALRVMTLAPERSGALDRIRRLKDRGVLVSLGHTDATYEEFLAGIDAGAAMATHLYNAMSPFRHRTPGAIGASLTDDRLTVGLIADGVHSHPASLRLALRAKGADRIALVTDMMPAAGMPPGTYEFGGQAVTVDGSVATLQDGTLAGSIVPLDQAIRNVVRSTAATPADAIRMASETPACLLGLEDRGRIASGCLADLVLFDANLNVETTIIGGEIVYRRENL